MTFATSYTLEELAKLTSSKLVGDSAHSIQGVASLESASVEHASFLANPLYTKLLKRSKAGVVFLTELPDFTSSNNYLIHPNPSSAFQKVIELFYNQDLYRSGFENIHPTAVIHPTAQIGEGVSIGPYTVVDQHAHIGNFSSIDSHVTIGPYVKIGSHCKIYASVTIRENCELHDSVILQPGAVIGSCGFGYITDIHGQHQKLLHVGRVVLESDVEIGANTTIDRGRFKDTLIKKGVKIDNQVQIGHGVIVGENSMLVSQSGVAGSTTLGRYNILAGQVGIVGHLTLGDHITIAARGAVTKNISKPGQYGGAPALPQEQFYKQIMHLRNLDHYVKKIKEIEAKISDFQNKQQKSKLKKSFFKSLFTKATNS